MPFALLANQGLLIKGLMALYLVISITDTVIAIFAITHDLHLPVQKLQIIAVTATTLISAIFQFAAWYVTRQFVTSAINLNTKMTLQVLCDISLPMAFAGIFAMLYAFTNNFLCHCLFSTMAGAAIKNYGKLIESPRYLR